MILIMLSERGMSPASGQRKRDEMLKTSCQHLDLSESLTPEGSHLSISVIDQQFPFDVGNFSWELRLSTITIWSLLNGISPFPKAFHLEAHKVTSFGRRIFNKNFEKK